MVKSTSYGSTYSSLQVNRERNLQSLFHNQIRSMARYNDDIQNSKVKFQNFLVNTLITPYKYDKKSETLDNNNIKVELSALKDFIHANKIKIEDILTVELEIANFESITCANIVLNKESLFNPKYELITLSPRSNVYKIYIHFTDLNNLYITILINLIGNKYKKILEEKDESNLVNTLRIKNIKIVYQKLN